MDRHEFRPCWPSDDLRQRYPSVYGPDSYIDVRPGWWNIVVALSERFKRRGTRVTSIGEKYGMLHVRFVGASPWAQRVAAMAVQESRTTCDWCGSAGEEIGDRSGWMSVRCPRHTPEGLMRSARSLVASIAKLIDGISFYEFCADEMRIAATAQSIQWLSDAAKLIHFSAKLPHPGMSWDMLERAYDGLSYHSAPTAQYVWELAQMVSQNMLDALGDEA